MDRLLAGLGKLRNRIGDVISEQSDVKVGLYGIRGQLREARHENRETSKVGVHLQIIIHIYNRLVLTRI